MSNKPHFPNFWLKDQWLAKILSPVGMLYGQVMRLRRQGYLREHLRRTRLPVPVVVVGNIFVGGTGKTPLVIWLVEAARQQGFSPGVILRGYGGSSAGPVAVSQDSDPTMVGDEAVLIAQRTQCPVVIGKNRVAAAQHLIAHNAVDLVISDDGLQHYALHRDIEIVVIDGKRGLGNRRCLPAGPLRECPERLNSVDLVISNGALVPESHGQFNLNPAALEPLSHPPHHIIPMAGDQVHAVAGIGNPQRFFDSLRQLGFQVIPHPFADHHAFKPADLSFGDELAIVMTEKDAVKCRLFAPKNSWMLPVTAEPDPTMQHRLNSMLASFKE